MQDRRIEVRKAAVRALGGSRDGVSLLCRAVADRSLDVSLAAVQALGQLQDPRAIPSLRSALRRCYAGGQRALDALVAGIWLSFTVIFLFGILILPPSFLVVPALYLFGIPMFSRWHLWRQRRCEYFEAIDRALRDLTAVQPSAELRLALVDLKALANSPVILDRESRDRSRELCARIDTVTHDLRDLPAPARGAETAWSALPRPSPQPAETRPGGHVDTPELPAGGT